MLLMLRTSLRMPSVMLFQSPLFFVFFRSKRLDEPAFTLTSPETESSEDCTLVTSCLKSFVRSMSKFGSAARMAGHVPIECVEQLTRVSAIS